MAAQSFAMGHAFGTSFQYGKRKISSMTNEEFNALSATDLHGQLQADIRAMIPNMNQSFKTMEQFQLDIIGSMVNTLKLAGEQFFEWLASGGQTTSSTTDTSTSIIDIGTGGTSTSPPITEIQGGSRQDAPGSFIPNLQSYEDWLKEAGFDTAPPKPIAKKTISTIPVPYTYNPRRASAPRPPTLAYVKAEARRILQNIGNLNVRIWNMGVLIKKAIQTARAYGGKSARASKQLNIAQGLQAPLRDLQKKLANEYIQYKNLKRQQIPKS